MSHDFQMARSHNDKGYNLAVGEPFFIQDALSNYQEVKYNKGLTYPLTNGQPFLIEQLQRFYPDQHIIITHGAKYGLLAAFYAYRELMKFRDVSHRVPYWPSYPTLAKLSGLTFNQGGATIKVSTSPNNPDSSETTEKCDIWDAAYSSTLLYKASRAPEHTVAVHSASKSFGFSGLRVGWVVTPDPELAKLMSAFMEITTSGVSVASQGHVADLLKSIGSGYETQVVHVGFKKARETLELNAELFRLYVSPLCERVDGLPVNSRGMFAWFKAKDHARFEAALAASEVKLVTGIACGMTEEGWYRMNLGHRTTTIKAALTLLADKYG